MKIRETSIEAFCRNLAAGSATPGGGSTAALAGALAAALCSMVGRLTLDRPKFKDVDPEMREMIDAADCLSSKLLDLADQDMEAYNWVMEAFKLPKETDAQNALRRKALQEGFKEASRIPLQTLQSLEIVSGLVRRALMQGNPGCFTDAAVAAELIRAASRGAGYNVRINLPQIQDPEYVRKTESELTEMLGRIFSLCETLEKTIEARMGRHA